jgi:hypothetical protein
MLRVNQFIRAVLNLPEGKGPVTIKDGKFTELEPTVFNEDELKAFFAACNPFQFAVFKGYLMAGLRKQELENFGMDGRGLQGGHHRRVAEAGVRSEGLGTTEYRGS